MQKEKDCTPQEMVGTEAGGLLYAGPAKALVRALTAIRIAFACPFFGQTKKGTQGTVLYKKGL